MAMIIYLLDKSATSPRLGAAAQTFREHLVIRGQLAVCEMTALELLYSARNTNDYATMARDLAAYRHLPTTNEAMQRALAVQQMLAEQREHRRPLPDLIVAATAELHGATVLHHDRDFQIIADVTGQPVERLPAG